MKQNEIYQLLSFLLQYPDKEKLAVLSELKDEIDLIEAENIRTNIQNFLSEIEEMTLDAWIQEYVDQFDFGKKTNLYVTYLKLGEQRERGLELLKLKKFYQAAGYEITERELPDYLPLMLEFSGNITKEIRVELLQMYEQAVWEIRDKLAEIESVYLFLFDGMLQLFELDGIEHVDFKRQQPPTANLEDQAIIESMRQQLIKNQLV